MLKKKVENYNNNISTKIDILKMFLTYLKMFFKPSNYIFHKSPNSLLLLNEPPTYTSFHTSSVKIIA